MGARQEGADMDLGFEDLEFELENDFSNEFWDAHIETIEFKSLTVKELKNMGYLNIEEL